jgi:hypothetical protein
MLQKTVNFGGSERICTQRPITYTAHLAYMPGSGRTNLAISAGTDRLTVVGFIIISSSMHAPHCVPAQLPARMHALQHSINRTRTGPHRCQIAADSRLSESIPSDLSSYRSFFCYYTYTWAVQLITGVFHLHISFFYWFRVTRVLFCVF